MLLLVGSFESRSARVTSGVIGLVSFAGAGIATWYLWNNGDGTAFSGQLAADRYSALVQAIVCASGVASILLGWGTRRLGDRIAEYYALLCFAGAGMCLLASANGFVTLFVALELFSVSLYVLCALDVHNAASLESGLKYLVTGSVGSAALLFGSGLAYIATGSLRFDEIGKALRGGAPHTGILLLGIAMIIAGFAFKVSAAPFHMWTPDVYEGAPTAVMAFMATATKTIALATLLRVMVTAFAPTSGVWQGARGGGRHRLDADRQHRRPAPDERQAHAGLLERRPGGLPPDRRGRAHAALGASDALLPGRLRGHEPRRDRRGRRCASASSAGRSRSTTCAGSAAITRCSPRAWRSACSR